MKKMVAKVLVICMMAACLNGLSISALADENHVTYIPENSFVASADGLIKLSTSEVTTNDFSSADIYWGDENGVKLSNYNALYSEAIPTEIVAGVRIDNDVLIPSDAKTIVIEIKKTDESTGTFSCEIPAEKLSSESPIYSTFMISDTHVNYREKSNESSPMLHTDTMIGRFKDLKVLADELNTKGDNVVGISIVGDIATGSQTKKEEDGNYWISDEHDYVEVNEVLSGSGIESYPIFYTNGNHDNIDGTNGDGSAWINFLDAKIAAYNTKLDNSDYSTKIAEAVSKISKGDGVYWYDTSIAGYHHIYLSVPHTGYKIDQEQLEWLEGLLKADQDNDKPTFVYGHYPIQGTTCLASNHTGAMSNGTDLKAIFDKYPNTIYISGHTHTDHMLDSSTLSIGNGKTTYLNTGGFLSTIENVFRSTGIYCRVFADRIEFQTRVFSDYGPRESLYDKKEAGYWISGSSRVLTLNKSTDNFNATLTADSERLTNGTTFTVKMNGEAVDTNAYNCEWYVDNTLVKSGTASYQVSYYYDESNNLVTPNGMVSVKVINQADTTKYEWYSYDGKLEIFREIGTRADLEKIGKEADYPLDGAYILTADIDLGTKDWTPIGDMLHTGAGGKHFTGIFDGNGHKISNLTISDLKAPHEANKQIQMYGGLFAHLEGATVRNLVMENANITAKDGTWRPYIGVLAGNIESVITGAGKRTEIENVAIIGGNLTVNWASNNICGAGSIAGSSDIMQCTQSESKGVFINNCYSTANVTVNPAGGQSCAGGLIGYAYNAQSEAVSINNAIYDGIITGTKHKGGVIGRSATTASNKAVLTPTWTNVYTNASRYTSTTGIEPIANIDGIRKTTEELQNSTVFDLKLGKEWTNSTNGPILVIAGGGAIQISTAEQLAKIGVDTENYPLDGYYILTNDIDLSSYENWDPIGDNHNVDDSKMTDYQCFAGTLDGNGYTIKNLTINATTVPSDKSQMFYGLFAGTRGAKIENLKFKKANISVSLPEKNSSGTAVQVFAGIVTGAAEADSQGKQTVMKNVCIVDSIINSLGTNHVSGVASFAGTTNKRWNGNNARNGALVLSDCFSDATVANNSYNGQGCAGGLIGYAYDCKTDLPSNLNNCIFLGTVNGNKCYGSVIGRLTKKGEDIYVNATNIYVDPDIANSASEESFGPVDGTDYQTTYSIENMGYAEKSWYDTPVGVKHALCLIVGDVDGNSTIDSVDTGYVRTNLIGAAVNCDDRTVDVNEDTNVDVRDLIRHTKIRN